MAIAMKKKRRVLFSGLMLGFHGTIEGMPSRSYQAEACASTNSSSVKRHCKQNQLKEALRILQNTEKPVESSALYQSLLESCIEKKSLTEGKLVHAHIIQRGFMADIFLASTLINMYAKGGGTLAEAQRIFDQLPKRDAVSWTVMIAAYSKQGRREEAKELFYQMKRLGFQPNEYTFVSILPACSDSAAVEEIHGEIVTCGFEQNVILGNTLVDMYAKCGNIENARYMLDKMPQPNVVSWTTLIAGYLRNGYVGEALELFQTIPHRTVFSWTAMISGYVQNGHGDEALEFFRQMQLTGVKPNSNTFTSVLPACANLAALKQGMEIHAQVTKSELLQSDVFVENALVDMYGKCGEMEKARELFDKMHQRDIVSWTAIIAGCTQGGLVEEALDLFRQMPQRDAISWNAMISGFARNGFVDKAFELFKEMPEPNVASWNAIITGFAQKGFVDKALRLFNEMPQRDVVSWNAMIAGYAQNGFVDEALELFQELPQPNLVSWNAMIAGLTQNGHGEKALKLFRQMELACVKPNSKTYASILPACAKLSALEQGMEIHEKTISSGYQSDVFVMTALVDMYAQCGSIEKARELFDKLHPRAVVSWNAMIGGYAMNGRGKEALELFEQMKQSGMTPDHITLVSVLSACSHAGLVDEGYLYFNYMREQYHITPAIEHYVCMVDLLGRAGRLDEAEDLIIRMPIKPDAVVWICLLSACRIHNNLQLAERVAEHIFELDPENTAPYVLLSNMYATLGRWGDIEKVRKMMRNRGINKTPGCSWIEVNKQVHAFLEGDTSHQQMQKIYRVGETTLGDESSDVCFR